MPRGYADCARGPCVLTDPHEMCIPTCTSEGQQSPDRALGCTRSALFGDGLRNNGAQPLLEARDAVTAGRGDAVRGVDRARVEAAHDVRQLAHVVEERAGHALLHGL